MDEFDFIATYLAPLAGVADSLTALSIPGEANTLTSAETAQAARDVGLKAKGAPDLAAALQAILDADANARVLICGSLYLAGAVLRENA